MPRVVHFEIPADDPERAAGFYKEVFGWQFRRWDGPMDYWMVMTGDPSAPGIDGGMSRRQGGAAVTNTIDVPSVDEYCQKVADAGGAVVVAKTAIPGVGWLAYIKDTEGNVFGIMTSDMDAK
jgi:predicted enzyme related to lactoylglutathione lyase